MTVDLDALEALAKAANSGLWRSRNNLDVYAPSLRELPSGEEQDDTICQTLEVNDAEFIAAANPATVLALVSEIRQERERAEFYQTELHTSDGIAQMRLRRAHKAEAALSRAEGAIENARLWLTDERMSVEQKIAGAIANLTEYDKQKGASDD